MEKYIFIRFAIAICAPVFLIITTINASNASAYESKEHIHISELSDESVVELIMAYYRLMPDAVKGLMQELNVDIFIMPSEWLMSSELNAKSASEGGVAGAYSTSGVVYVNENGEIKSIQEYGKIVCYTDMDELFFPEQLIHEAGHELEYMNVYLTGFYPDTEWFPYSRTSEFERIYTSESISVSTIDTLAELNCKRGKEEFFAELFRLYCEYPDNLKTVAPESYGYMEMVLNDLAEKKNALVKEREEKELEEKKKQAEVDLIKEEIENLKQERESTITISKPKPLNKYIQKDKLLEELNNKYQEKKRKERIMVIANTIADMFQK